MRSDSGSPGYAPPGNAQKFAYAIPARTGFPDRGLAPGMSYVAVTTIVCP